MAYRVKQNMSCCTLQDQVHYIAIYNIVMWCISVVIAILLMNNIEYTSIQISPVMDPIIVISLFGLSLVVYILCLRGCKTGNKQMLIPFLIFTLTKIVGFTGIAAHYIILSKKGEYLTMSHEFIVYPVVSIALGTLNIYFLVMVIKYYQEIHNGQHTGYNGHKPLPHLLTTDIQQQGFNETFIVKHVL